MLFDERLYDKMREELYTRKLNRIKEDIAQHREMI